MSTTSRAKSASPAKAAQSAPLDAADERPSTAVMARIRSSSGKVSRYKGQVESVSGGRIAVRIPALRRSISFASPDLLDFEQVGFPSLGVRRAMPIGDNLLREGDRLRSAQLIYKDNTRADVHFVTGADGATEVRDPRNGWVCPFPSPLIRTVSFERVGNIDDLSNELTSSTSGENVAAVREPERKRAPRAERRSDAAVSDQATASELDGALSTEAGLADLSSTSLRTLCDDLRKENRALKTALLELRAQLTQETLAGAAPDLSAAVAMPGGDLSRVREAGIRKRFQEAEVALRAAAEVQPRPAVAQLLQGFLDEVAATFEARKKPRSKEEGSALCTELNALCRSVGEPLASFPGVDDAGRLTGDPEPVRLNASWRPQTNKRPRGWVYRCNAPGRVARTVGPPSSELPRLQLLSLLRV